MRVKRLVPAICVLALAGPAMAQGDWLPMQPPAGLVLRVWLTGSEAATVNLSIRFGDEPWCRISGRFDPEHHVSPTGYVAAATPCGLSDADRARLGGDAPVMVALKGSVRLDSGDVLTVSSTAETDLTDLWDATIEVADGHIAFEAVKG